MLRGLSELTVETGELPVCVNCQFKHAVGLLHHVDPEMEKAKYDKTIELINDIGKGLMMTSTEIEDFIKAYRLEHKVEDVLTVLRDLRHKIMEGSEERFEALSEWHPWETNNPSNPGAKSDRMILPQCNFTKEQVKHKEYFDKNSFRTLCPECPEGRCALCPPDLQCTTRVVIGCPKGEFVKGTCRVGTTAHVIYHGR